MKFTLRQLKPRNPLVALCRVRKAGRHRMSRGAQRQGAERAARREMQQAVSVRGV